MKASEENLGISQLYHFILNHRFLVFLTCYMEYTFLTVGTSCEVTFLMNFLTYLKYAFKETHKQKCYPHYFLNFNLKKAYIALHLT